MAIPGMTQFEMLQARGQAIWEQSRDGTPGINPLGEWQARFEGAMDGSIDNTLGKVFNHHHIGIKGGLGLLGAAGAIGAGEAYFDPQVARVMHNAAPWAAGALGLGAAGAVANGFYAGKVKRNIAQSRLNSKISEGMHQANQNKSTFPGADQEFKFSSPEKWKLRGNAGMGDPAYSSRIPWEATDNPIRSRFNINTNNNLPEYGTRSKLRRWLDRGRKGHKSNYQGIVLEEDMLGAEMDAVSKGDVLYEGYLKPLGKLLGRGALKTGEKGFGMIGGALKLAGSTAGAAMHVAAGMELSSRALLTAQPLALFSKNTPMMSNNMLDAYLPNFRNLPAGNIMKYAPNPSIIRRATAGMWAAGAVSMVHEMIAPSAPPPTAVFDGRYLHHKNDMGANAQYGQAILGRNSELMDPQKIGMYAAHLL